jgi:predicted GH43/DUF377 family glycosyl hydrolase
VHPRDGPVAAANEKIENWEKVGAITIDERKDNICKGGKKFNSNFLFGKKKLLKKEKKGVCWARVVAI